MKIKQYLKSIVVNCFSLFPLKENVILFESNSEIKDSSKNLFEKCLDLKINDKYKMVWLVDNPQKYIEEYKNYNNIKFIYKSKLKTSLSLKRLYYCCTAKYCFYTHLLIGLRTKPGQIKVFLTHGTPIKDTRGLFWDPYLNTNIISTSEFAASLRCKTFNGGSDIIKIFGFPRNDVLFKTNDNVDRFIDSLSENRFIIWLPTFKHFNIKSSKRVDYLNDTSNDITLLNQDNLLELNDLLKKNKIVMIIKFHPAQDMNYVIKKDFSNIIMMSNEDLTDKNIDLYSLMGKSSALITDFSSVYIDYLLVDKPIGFELNDYENFKNGRGFIVDDPIKLMPGNKIFNKNDLFNFICNISNEIDEYADERRELKDKMHKFQDEKSSERILDYYNLKRR